MKGGGQTDANKRVQKSHKAWLSVHDSACSVVNACESCTSISFLKTLYIPL